MIWPNRLFSVEGIGYLTYKQNNGLKKFEQDNGKIWCVSVKVLCINTVAAN